MATYHDHSVFDRARLEMSEFIARELLYDYMMGHLDGKRRRSVEDMLQNSEANQQDLRCLRAGNDYCNQLAECEVAEELLGDLRSSDSLFRSFVKSMDVRSWPAPVRWSIEGLMVALLIGLVVSRFPIGQWISVNDDDSLLVAKIDRSFKKSEGPGETQVSVKKPEPPAPSPEQKAIASNPVEPIKDKQEEKNPTQFTKPKPKILPKTELKPGTKAGVKPAEVRPTEVKPKASPVRPQPAGAAGNAFVYRLYIFRSNVDGVAPSVVGDISGLGGERAGKVELGWKKEKGRYFHFKMDSDNHDQLIDKLKQYGSVRIRKNDHPRVMPAGTFRYILWMEETGS